MSITGFTLLIVTSVITAIALLFALIALSTSRWLFDGTGLWNCQGVCSSTGAALAILSVIILAAAILSIVILLAGILPQKFRLIPLTLLTFATIFLLATTTSYLLQLKKVGYSYELMVTANTFAFIASIVLAFWLGTSMHGRPVTGTMKPVAFAPSFTVPASRILP